MATIKQKRAFKEVGENGGNISKAMKVAGYSITKPNVSTEKLTKSKGWEELMEKHLPDSLLAKKHRELLNSTDIGHMVFPIAITDKEITKLLATVNCVPQKIMHGDTANHVWFWARDNKALKDGLDMAYKLKGSYKPEKKEHSGELRASVVFLPKKDAE